MLVDGVRATSRFNDGCWLGLEGEDLEAVIDLGKKLSIEKVSAGFLENQDSWIFLPLSLELSFSDDGRNFHSVQKIENRKPKENSFVTVRDFSKSVQNMKARYVRVRAENIKTCPGWHKGAGGKAWIFADEIIVE